MGRASEFLRRAKSVFMKNTPLSWACVVSTGLLLLLSALQIARSPIIQLPVQWLWISVIPILLTLLVGGYICKFKGAGFEFEPGMRLLPYAQPGPIVSPAPRGDLNVSLREEVRVSDLVEAQTDVPWQDQREAEYARTGELFIVHVYRRSTQPNQLYDITLFLIRHVHGTAPNQKTGFADVEKAEFYFGPSWHGEVFVAHNDGGYIGVRTSAWGTFLATCRVTFRDSAKAPLILQRYVDFEMAPEKA